MHPGDQRYEVSQERTNNMTGNKRLLPPLRWLFAAKQDHSYPSTRKSSVVSLATADTCRAASANCSPKRRVVGAEMPIEPMIRSSPSRIGAARQRTSFSNSASSFSPVKSIVELRRSPAAPHIGFSLGQLYPDDSSAVAISSAQDAKPLA